MIFYFVGKAKAMNISHNLAMNISHNSLSQTTVLENEGDKRHGFHSPVVRRLSLSTIIKDNGEERGIFSSALGSLFTQFLF